MRIVIITAAAGLTILGLRGVGTQAAEVAGGNRWDPQQSSTVSPPQSGPASGALFTLGGIGVHVWSPVERPYDGAGTYRTYAGQPASPESNLLAPEGTM
jgi:hypothetical protein